MTGTTCVCSIQISEVFQTSENKLFISGQ